MTIDELSGPNYCFGLNGGGLESVGHAQAVSLLKDGNTPFFFSFTKVSA